MKDIKPIIDAISELSKRLDSLEQAAFSRSNKRTVWELSRIMEAKERAAEELKDSGSIEVATGREWRNPEDRKRYRQLIRDIEQINHQLSSMA